MISLFDFTCSNSTFFKCRHLFKVNHISNFQVFLVSFCCPEFWVYWHFDLVSNYELRYIVEAMPF